MKRDLTTVRYDGVCAFRLMPDDPLVEGESSATLGRAGDGVVLNYTWMHPDDGEQQGILLVGGIPADGPVEAALFDTWHQHPDLMALTGSREGDRIELSATYLGDWGWEIALHFGVDSASMTMRNVVPESALADLPEGAPPMAAGPYDVMVARWSAASGG